MKKNINMDIELVFIILSIIVTGGLAVNANISSKKKDIALETKTNELVALQNEVNTNSKKLIEAQDELLKFTLGGDSYCAMILGDFANDVCIAKVGNFGEKYPLYDVEYNLVDVDYLIDAEKKGITFQNHSEIWKHFNIGNLQSKSAHISGAISLGNYGKERRFNVFFNARNGSFNQQIVLRKKGEKWYVAWSVSNHEGEEIEKRISDGFLNQNEPDYIFPKKPIGELIVGNSTSK